MNTRIELSPFVESRRVVENLVEFTLLLVRFTRVSSRVTLGFTSPFNPYPLLHYRKVYILFHTIYHLKKEVIRMDRLNTSLSLISNILEDCLKIKELEKFNSIKIDVIEVPNPSVYAGFIGATNLNTQDPDEKRKILILKEIHGIIGEKCVIRNYELLSALKTVLNRLDKESINKIYARFIAINNNINKIILLVPSNLFMDTVFLHPNSDIKRIIELKEKYKKLEDRLSKERRDGLTRVLEEFYLRDPKALEDMIDKLFNQL